MTTDLEHQINEARQLCDRGGALHSELFDVWNGLKGSLADLERLRGEYVDYPLRWQEAWEAVDAGCAAVVRLACATIDLRNESASRLAQLEYPE